MDVDEMVSEMTPEEMDGWIAYDRVQPIGLEKVCWVLATGFAALMDRIAEAAGAKDYTPKKPKDFIWWAKKKKPQPEYTNPNAMAAAFKMAVG